MVMPLHPDDFDVVHQSTEDVQLPLGNRAVPLYCVVAGHSLGCKYQWGQFPGG